MTAPRPGASCPLRWTPPDEVVIPDTTTYVPPARRWRVDPDDGMYGPVGWAGGLAWPRTDTGRLLATIWRRFGDRALLDDDRYAALITERLGVPEDDWSLR